MSSRTLPTSHDTLAALAAFLQAELTGQQIQVHGAELPAGWQPSTAVKGVLIQPDGGAASVNVPELIEDFTLHSYGVTVSAARAVDLAVFNVLHRPMARTAVVGASTYYLPFAQRTAGPIWNREPVTEWPRWTSTYRVVFSEFAAP